MPYSLSPSAINVFRDCQKCFWLQHRKSLKRPDGIFPSLPGGMDRILKAHFDSYLEKETLPNELIKHKIDARLFGDWRLLDKWRDVRWGITFTDERGNTLRGAVDNILSKDGKLIVLDYKTRGHGLMPDTHEHYRDQMNFYNYLLRKNGYDTEDYSYLLFYHPDKVIDSIFLFNTDVVKLEVNVESAEALWKKALAALDGSMPKSSPGCVYCSYRDARFDSSLLDF